MNLEKGHKSGKGRRLTVPPHNTHHAGPQWAFRGNYRVPMTIGNIKSRSAMYTTDTPRRNRGKAIP